MIKELRQRKLLIIKQKVGLIRRKVLVSKSKKLLSLADDINFTSDYRESFTIEARSRQM